MADEEDVASLKRICVFDDADAVGAGGRRTSEVISRTMIDFMDGWDWTSWRRWYDAREHIDFSVSP